MEHLRSTTASPRIRRLRFRVVRIASWLDLAATAGGLAWMLIDPRGPGVTMAFCCFVAFLLSRNVVSERARIASSGDCDKPGSGADALSGIGRREARQFPVG